MKRKIINIIIIILVVIVNVASYYTLYKIGYKSGYIIGMSEGYSTGMSIGYSANSTKKLSTAAPELFDNDVIGRYDYPLMEVFLDDNDKYSLIIRDHISSKNEIYRIITNFDVLDRCREKIAVLTFPIGRGTTPNGSLYLYKNHTLIKEVPYFEVYILKEIPNEDIKFVTYDKIKQLVGNELPPLF